MLKKYKTSARMLTVLQLKEIKGGIGIDAEAAMQPQCFQASDCGHTVCGDPDFTAWYCIKRRCVLLYC